MKATVTGDRDLIRKLQDALPKKAKKAARKGSRAGAKVVQAKAKELVPVRSGALKKEVKVRALKRSRKYVGTQVTTKVKDGPTYYGGFVEFGTKKMHARHFIRRAFDASKAAAGGAFVAGMREELGKP